MNKKCGKRNFQMELTDKGFIIFNYSTSGSKVVQGAHSSHIESNMSDRRDELKYTANGNTLEVTYSKDGKKIRDQYSIKMLSDDSLVLVYVLPKFKSDKLDVELAISKQKGRLDSILNHQIFKDNKVVDYQTLWRMNYTIASKTPLLDDTGQQISAEYVYNKQADTSYQISLLKNVYTAALKNAEEGAKARLEEYSMHRLVFYKIKNN